jgi:sialate O-acetylesterase
MIIPSRRLAAALVLLLALHPLLRAEVKLPAIFGDHMVLQGGAKLPVWGTAAPGEAVTVTLGADSAKATADASGKWRVDLNPLPAATTALTMTVAGTNTLTFQDVLIGEVWLCSGQSNMEFPMSREYDASVKIPQANDPQLRLFLVAKKTSIDPVDDVTGSWQLCTPDSVKEFSAVGYFFGRQLRQKLHRPVGLIGSYWGGTPAQSWTSLEGLQKDAELQHYVQDVQKTRASLPQATADYPAKMAAYKSAMMAWEQKRKADALAAGQPVPVGSGPGMPQPPVTPDGGQRAPANLYNGMIAPLIPYAIKGALWYQGEANAGAAAEYRVLFARMITDWRERWAEGDFPFLFVQLAGYEVNRATVPAPLQAKLAEATDETWPFLRDSQTKTLALPNTGMATAIDIGNPNNIHPTDKEDDGKRLALLARHIAYGEDLVDSGPMYKSMTVSGGAISLSFTETGGGLVIGKAPWVAPAPDGRAVPTDKLRGFIIAGADQKWVPARAKIVGHHVIVSSPEVSAPAAVRYDWTGFPDGNLYNTEGLPAPSFRTDDWPQSAPKAPGA